VAIARALVGQPAIVLADEPTGNLDQASGQSVLRLFEELHRTGVTIVIITHDRGIAARTSRQVDMFDGRIVSDSTQDSSSTSPSPGRSSRPARVDQEQILREDSES
jgi:putative ABC transport system ATP-binding protein